MMLKLAQWSFLVLVASLPFVRPFSFFAFGLRVSYTDVIFIAATAAAALALAIGKLKLRYDRAFIFIGLYAAAITITAILPEASVVKLFSEYYLFALSFLTFVHCNDRDFLKRVIMVWVAATGITSLLSLIGVVLFYWGLTTETNNYFLSHLGSLPPGNYPRVQSLFANPNMLCNYLNIGIPLVWLAGRLGWISSRPTKALLAAAVLATLFSLSPGIGGIALSMGVIGYVILERERFGGRLILIGGIIAASAIFAVTLISPDTPNTDHQVPFSNGTIEPSVRVLVWENVIDRVSASPVLGRGIGSSPAQREYFPLTGERQFLTDAHNMYLNVLGQSGLIGLACFIVLLVHLARRPVRVFDPPQDLIARVLRYAFVGTFLYQGLSGSFEDARHVWVLIGMLVSATTAASFKSDISQASTAL